MIKKIITEPFQFSVMHKEREENYTVSMINLASSSKILSHLTLLLFPAESHHTAYLSHCHNNGWYDTRLFYKVKEDFFKGKNNNLENILSETVQEGLPAPLLQICQTPGDRT